MVYASASNISADLRHSGTILRNCLWHRMGHATYHLIIQNRHLTIPPACKLV
jgi:hypothetical protein